MKKTVDPMKAQQLGLKGTIKQPQQTCRLQLQQPRTKAILTGEKYTYIGQSSVKRPLAEQQKAALKLTSVAF